LIVIIIIIIIIMIRRRSRRRSKGEDVSRTITHLIEEAEVELREKMTLLGSQLPPVHSAKWITSYAMTVLENSDNRE
jgi:hypothetical protein